MRIFSSWDINLAYIVFVSSILTSIISYRAHIHIDWRGNNMYVGIEVWYNRLLIIAAESLGRKWIVNFIFHHLTYVLCLEKMRAYNMNRK